MRNELSLGLSGALGIRYRCFMDYVYEEWSVTAEREVSRARFRAFMWPRVLLHFLKRSWHPFPKAPEKPETILVIGVLLLGDVLMLSGLLKRLRQRYPHALIRIAVPPSVVPLFSGRPWDVEAVAISPRLPSTLKALCNLGTPDLAIIAGENRYAWIARAVGAKWIVGHQDMPRGFHSRALDQAIPYPAEPCSQTELLALLAGDGSLPPYEKGEWPSPRFQSFSRPAEPYVLLHVGASRALKRWSPDRWRRLANALASTGCLVIWSCGPGEEELLDEIEVEGVRYAGNLDLSQLWHLVAGAQAVICPDTGIAHLARVIGRPACVLVGPADVQLVGNGRFWSNMPCRWLNASVGCRDQPYVFNRPLPWSASCRRADSDCAENACMQGLDPESVLAVFSSLTPDIFLGKSLR